MCLGNRQNEVVQLQIFFENCIKNSNNLKHQCLHAKIGKKLGVSQSYVF